MEQTTSRTGNMTSRQKRDIRKLLYDALDELGFSNPQAQKVLGKGGTLKSKAKDIMRELATAEDLLERVNTVNLPAIDSFKAADRFKITPDKERKTADVVIGYLGDNFKGAFLSNSGKTEQAIPAVTFQAYKLRKASVDASIIAELGGHEAVESTLAQMYELMKAQGRGQQGILLTNGYANIFYIKDAKGVLWAVRCYWRSGGQCWDVCANPVSHPNTWRAGSRVFSRDSSGS